MSKKNEYIKKWEIIPKVTCLKVKNYTKVHLQLKSILVQWDHYFPEFPLEQRLEAADFFPPLSLSWLTVARLHLNLKESCISLIL